MKLTEKLLKIQWAEFRVDKDGKNPHFKSSYVTLDNLLSILLPIATENKIVITHYVFDKKLITQVINAEEENDEIVSEFPIYQEDPQKIGSAITYAKRYNLGAIFNIITEVDDDGNSVSGANHYTGAKSIEKLHPTTEMPLSYYIEAIKKEKDINALKILFEEALEIELSEPQKEMLVGVKDQRKKYLTDNGWSPFIK